MRYLKFWGVRGSIPSPGPETVRYGGNTACIELRIDDQIFILDAGSGLRNLGTALLLEDRPLQLTFLFSHTHWDHIQGLPFFMPAYNAKNTIALYGANDLRNILSGQMQPNYFPLKLDDVTAEISFHSLETGSQDVQGIPVEVFRLNHPGMTLGFRFKIGNTEIVYISDNEPADVDLPADPLLSFVKDADILIHDAQYTPEEYPDHLGWGHSPFTFPLELAIAAQVKKLVLFHHDPQHSDDEVDTILARARQMCADRSSSLEVIAASEGLTIEL